VLDVGTHSVKAGYAGDDGPKAVFPSACGVVAAAAAADGGGGASGDSRVKKGGAGPADGAEAGKEDGGGGEKDGGGVKKDARAGAAAGRGGGVFVGADGPSFARGDRMEVASPFDADGQVRDWDLAEALWRHALQDRLRVTDPADMALMVVEPTHATKASREACVERLFEALQCPAAYLAKAALLASFATARQTGVVVDAGHMATTGEFFYLCGGARFVLARSMFLATCAFFFSPFFRALAPPPPPPHTHTRALAFSRLSPSETPRAVGRVSAQNRCRQVVYTAREELGGGSTDAEKRVRAPRRPVGVSSSLAGAHRHPRHPSTSSSSSSSSSCSWPSDKRPLLLPPLDEQLLDRQLERLDLRLELRPLVGRDGARDDGPRDAARAAERRFRRHKDVGHVLVLGQEGQVQEDLDGLGVGGHDDELGDAAVERLGGCVCVCVVFCGWGAAFFSFERRRPSLFPLTPPPADGDSPSLAPFFSCL